MCDTMFLLNKQNINYRKFRKQRLNPHSENPTLHHSNYLNFINS